MHKARLGLLPADGSAVLLLSNLGGSMGGELTALKVRASTDTIFNVLTSTNW